MPVYNNRPDPSNWEYAWEAGVSGVKKQAAKVAGDVKRDVVESFVPKTEEEKQEAQKKHATVQRQVAGVDSQKLAQIEAEIKRIREEREKKERESVRVEEHENIKKDTKMFEKKKKDTALEKQIKSKKGTKEGMQRASG